MCQHISRGIHAIVQQPQHSEGADAATTPHGLRTGTLFVILGALGCLIFLITVYGIIHFVEGVPTYVSVAFALVVLVSIALSIIVITNLVTVFQGSRSGLRGARLHKRFVTLLIVVGVLPAIVAFALTGTVLSAFSDEYFVDRVSEADRVARDFANGYFLAESRKLGPEVVQLANDLNLQAQAGLSPETQPVGFRKYLLGQAILRNMSGITLVDSDFRIVMSVNRLEDGAYQLPPMAYFDEVSAEGAIPYKFDAHDRDSFDAYYALYYTPQDYFIVAYRTEDPALAQQIVSVRQFRDQTQEVRTRLADLSRSFAIGYGLVMLLLLLAAMWIGIIVANAVIGPVRRLATAAGAVSEGDLTSRVEIRKGDGELGELGQAFNDMTQQLQAQRDDLIAAHEQSDGRRRFIETVVSGVPAGVLNVRNDGRVALANPSAERILGAAHGRVHGADIHDVLPELNSLLLEASATPGHDVRDQIELSRGGVTRIINARISPDDPQQQSGYLVTLDDITELISAQRNAAWGDVARRIAHEIKNPLTPIQLSAERLKRRYGRKMGEDREVFDLCTDTIIRHVGDIGRMVNEFSSFARMPEPILAVVDLRETVRSAAFSFSVANPAIDFVFEIPDEPVKATCDGRLVGQAVVNLVKNAVEAILENDQSEPGRIIIRLEGTAKEAIIDIIDNGKGLPEKGRARLTEPYMTTRVKGTGLGLAIVRKAVEEHGGRFDLIDRGQKGERGAIARITLPGAESQTADREAIIEGDQPTKLEVTPSTSTTEIPEMEGNS